MAILDMVNATARKDSSGFLDHANPVEPIKPTMVLSVNALLDTYEMSMATVSNPTLSPIATRIKDMILPSKPVSVSKVHNISKESAKSSLIALKMHTTMVFNVPVKLDSHSEMATASKSTSSSPNAQPMPTSMECHAPATQDSTKAASVPVPHALKEPHGMECNAQVIHVQVDTSSTVCLTNANRKVHHAVPIHTGMEQYASVCQDSASSMANVNSVLQELHMMVLNAPVIPSAILQ